jgi:hypothetical protein
MAENPCKNREPRICGVSEEDAGGGTRTPDTRIMIPLSSHGRLGFPRLGVVTWVVTNGFAT